MSVLVGALTCVPSGSLDALDRDGTLGEALGARPGEEQVIRPDAGTAAVVRAATADGQVSVGALRRVVGPVAAPDPSAAVRTG
jgi:hypothetical protein